MATSNFSFSSAYWTTIWTEENCLCYPEALCLEKSSKYKWPSGITEKPTVHFQVENVRCKPCMVWSCFLSRLFSKKECLILFVIQYMSRFHIIFKAWRSLRSTSVISIGQLSRCYGLSLSKMTTPTYLVSERSQGRIVTENIKCFSDSSKFLIRTSRSNSEKSWAGQGRGKLHSRNCFYRNQENHFHGWKLLIYN